MKLRNYLKSKGKLNAFMRRVRRPPIPKRPIHLQKRYEAMLVAYVNELKKKTLPLIDSTLLQFRQDALDSFSVTLQMRLHSFLNPAIMAKDIGIAVDEWNGMQWKDFSKKAFGVNVFKEGKAFKPIIAEFEAVNTALIDSIPRTLHTEITQMVMEGFNAGIRAKELAQDIEKRFEVSKSRAEFIADDQINKLNAELTRARQESIGVTRYRWRTLRDERVRGKPSGMYPKADPSHWSMDGRICSWEDQTIYLDNGTWQDRSDIDGPYAHPSEEPRCRCVAEPILEDLLDMDVEEFEGGGFED